MRFVEIINQRKFTLISIFLFLYVMLNLLDGERGLISYYGKQQIIEKLSQEKKITCFTIRFCWKKEQSINWYYRCRLFRDVI